jgi:hypothetical protein
MGACLRVACVGRDHGDSSGYGQLLWVWRGTGEGELSGVGLPDGREPVEEFLHALIGAFGEVLSTWLVGFP